MTTGYAGVLLPLAAVWIFGPSRDTWNTLTLPLSLGVIGAPNCSILARPSSTN